MIKIEVKIKDRDRRALLAHLDDMSGPLREAVNQWGSRYQDAMRSRFSTYSRGGGDWAPLKESTRLGRRDPSGGTGRQRIAKKRAALHKARVALRKDIEKYGVKAPEKERAFERRVKRLAKVRSAKIKLLWEKTKQTERRIAILNDTGTLFGALSSAADGWVERELPKGIEVGFGGPAKYPDGIATIADIASFHQEGGPNLPAREILVDPPDSVKKAMAKDLNIAIKKVLAQGSG